MKDLSTLIYEAGILPTLFAEEEDCGARVVAAIERTAIPVVEVLQRGEMAPVVLKDMARRKTTAYIGAGTVCTLEHCKRMVDAGADFIVSPGYNPEIVDWCVANGVAVIPGVSNPSEMMMATNAGLTLCKFFPFNELGGEKGLNGLSGPFPQMKFIITGCIDDRGLTYLSNRKIAGIGGVWPFQTETEHHVISEQEIVDRLNRTIEIGKHFRTDRNAWY